MSPDPENDDVLARIARRVDEILDEAENHMRWGGDEDKEGRLEPGPVDWADLRANVRKAFHHEP